jgi:hypothetical protein
MILNYDRQTFIVQATGPRNKLFSYVFEALSQISSKQQGEK